MWWMDESARIAEEEKEESLYGGLNRWGWGCSRSHASLSTQHCCFSASEGSEQPHRLAACGETVTRAGGTSLLPCSPGMA